ncbi:MAG: hypothetical protein DMF91_17560 [Acidobacteria bacterium]|nr:MAG: hypothetical protein DMF91_17560 [Acidobacteriota bacterium]
MNSNRFAFAALGLACILAAAGGGYLASRQNATSQPVAAAAPAAPSPSAPSPSAATPAGQPVQETEALVAERMPKTSSSATPSAAASSVKPTVARTSTRPSANAEAGSAHQAQKAAPPPLERTWPAGAASTPSASSPSSGAGAPSADGNAAQAAKPEDRAVQEPPRAPEPPAKVFDELIVSADSVIGLQTENTISSETARVEDRVDARVTRDVRVGDKVAIPSGTRAIGSVTQVDRGGKFKERAHLGIRFHTLVLADGTRVPISTETITRDGDAPSSAAKIGGGAVGGAILGAILGGAKGAVIGGATGAGAGAAATAAGDRSAASLPAGTQTTVRILSPVTVTVER